MHRYIFIYWYYNVYKKFVLFLDFNVVLKNYPLYE
jgi:hypothetical protein